MPTLPTAQGNHEAAVKSLADAVDAAWWSQNRGRILSKINIVIEHGGQPSAPSLSPPPTLSAR
ncbi:MAG: hypothetical protein ACKVY0_09590 [Prosthecobacter sp.]|uniref:hypothetical protein n=1 Tax=Prosthecobacter sp. TaxID=1965333 RepID=UPI0039000308